MILQRLLSLLGKVIQLLLNLPEQIVVVSSANYGLGH
jgi:hypothetical protein